MKEFDKAVSDTSLAESFSTVSGHLCDNVDGESLVYGYSRIIKRKEKRKLMIVLSDGAPCGGHDRGDISAYTRSVIRNIEKTPVELLGIGLMHDTSKWYKNSAVIKNASSTSTALLSIITNKIIK
jgi:cobaltochelatase CobT